MICMICGRMPLTQEDKESWIETDDGWSCPECAGEDAHPYGYGMHTESLYGDDEIPEEEDI